MIQHEYSRPQIVNTTQLTYQRSKKATATGDTIGTSQNIMTLADICGPMSVPTFSKNKYFLKMATAPLQYVTVYSLDRKMICVSSSWDSMFGLVETKKRKVRLVHTENAADSLMLQNPFQTIGIIVTTSVAHTARSKRIDEAIYGLLVGNERAMLKDDDLRKLLWSNILVQVVYLQNWTVTPRWTCVHEENVYGEAYWITQT